MIRAIAFWLSTIIALFAVQQFMSWHPGQSPELVLFLATSLFSFVAGLLAKKL